MFDESCVWVLYEEYLILLVLMVDEIFGSKGDFVTNPGISQMFGEVCVCGFGLDL